MCSGQGGRDDQGYFSSDPQADLEALIAVGVLLSSLAHEASMPISILKMAEMHAVVRNINARD